MGRNKNTGMASVEAQGEQNYKRFMNAANNLEQLRYLLGYEKLEELRLALLSSELELPSFEHGDQCEHLLWIGRNIEARDENALVIAEVDVHIHWVGSTWAIQS